MIATSNKSLQGLHAYVTLVDERLQPGKVGTEEFLDVPFAIKMLPRCAEA